MNAPNCSKVYPLPSLRCIRVGKNWCGAVTFAIRLKREKDERKKVASYDTRHRAREI